MVKKDLRLRVFAGPNGSGKSTVIEYVRSYRENNKAIDFGHYINADDIAKSLKVKGTFGFDIYDVTISHEKFIEVALSSGLISDNFTEDDFLSIFSIQDNIISCKTTQQEKIERLAQILADVLRKILLESEKKFSFETVFSHEYKLNIMRKAKEQGYKVYLYFVSTASPEINKFRVAARKKKGGHDVPVEKIENRYFRSLDLLYEAAQLAYQVYFIDNSVDGELFKMFAHFKLIDDKKKWDDINDDDIPGWFIKYYYNKQ